MPDTQRSQAALLALLADNSKGDITPQVMRDLLVTALGVYGGLYTCDAVSTQSVSSAAKVTINQFENAEPANGVTAEPANNRLVLTLDGIYEVFLHVTYESTAPTAVVYKIRALLDGVGIPGACARVSHHSQLDVYSIAVMRHVTATANQVVQAEVESLDPSTYTFDVKHAMISARLVG